MPLRAAHARVCIPHFAVASSLIHQTTLMFPSLSICGVGFTTAGGVGQCSVSHSPPSAWGYSLDVLHDLQHLPELGRLSARLLHRLVLTFIEIERPPVRARPGELFAAPIFACAASKCEIPLEFCCQASLTLFVCRTRRSNTVAGRSSIGVSTCDSTCVVWLLLQG